MGLFKDLRKLQKVSKDVSKDYDPVAQMQNASAQMQRMTEQTQLVASGTSATATVAALRDTGMMVNMQPVMEVDLTVFPPGGTPFPATITTHGHAPLAGLAPGASVAVRYDPNDPSKVALAS